MALQLITPPDLSEDPHVASKPSVPLIPRDLMPFSGPMAQGTQMVYRFK